MFLIHEIGLKFLDRRKLSNGTDTVLSRTSHKSQKTPKANISRKLEMEFSKAFFGTERRRIKSNEKEISSSSSAASSDAEDDSHIDIVLNQSRRDLENTQALKIRRHLLHSEDYVSQWTLFSYSFFFKILIAKISILLRKEKLP